MSRKNSRQMARLVFFGIAFIFLLALVFGVGWDALHGTVTLAASPSSGTISPSSPNVAYMGGPFNGLNQTNQASSATIVCTTATPCDDYALAVNIPSGDPNTYSFTVRVSWTTKATPTSSANDFDLYVYDSQGNVVQSSASSANPEVATVTVKDSNYKIRVLPFDVNMGANGDTYNATVMLAVVPGAPPIPPPGPTVPGDPRYQSYAAPDGLGTTAGEPSIGVDWPTGKVFISSNLQTLRVSFDDCSSPAKATWEDKSAPTSQEGLDPILFTDHNGLAKDRTFVSQLTGQDSATSFTDDDGESWTPSQGGGIPSGVDHQTIGGGPYNASSTPPPPPHPTYPNAIYYCSQDVAASFCARSDNGGQTFGAGVPIWTINQCGGIHGHVKVAPDGTVYVPNKSCGGKQGFSMSRDNGVTWTVVTDPNSTATSKLVDPSVGIGKNGTVYFAYEGGADASNSFPPRVAVAKVAANGNVTWSNDQQVGGNFNIKNAVFPEAISSAFNPSATTLDDDRAAVAFLGTTASGDYTNTSFKGTWHLFIATTFDGGQHWTTVDATPNDPVQRGSICTLGTTACNHTPDDRNLLDFMDMTIDRQGRVLVGYPDGCIGGCVNGLDNSFTALASIARQSGGKRIISAFDPPEPALPGAPVVTAVSDATGIHLSWQAPDNGGSPITNYKVYRRPENGQTALLANVGVTLNFDDLTADPTVKYFYSVSAVNAIGEGPICGEVSAVALPKVDACTPPGVLLVTDPTGDGTPPTPALDIEKLSVAEPFDAANPNASKLTWTMKVASGTVTPNSQWYIIWDFGNGLRRYVAMLTDASNTPSFRYGHVGPPLNATSPDPAANKPFDEGAADSGSIAADGTIVIKISNSKVTECVPTDSTFSTCSPSSNTPKAGSTLANISPRTFSGSGTTNVTGSSATDSTSNTPAYTLVGNAFCRPNNAPIARLNASPTAGTAPLTVNFDASTSSDPDVGDAIASYTFDFGDTFVTQQSSPTIAHVYNSNGTYQVKLYVRDTRGKLSASPATATIVVGNVPPAATFQFNAATNSIGEGGGRLTVTVTRNGDASGSATIDYQTADTDTFTVGCADTVNNHGSAYGRCDFEIVAGTLSFGAGETTKSFTIPIIDDSRAEGNETFTVVLSNPLGATLGTPATATATIVDNDAVNGPNPILRTDDPGIAFFVRLHYLDFLGREPEAGEPWSAILRGCSDQFNTNPASPATSCDRINVSSAFFGSPEFKDTGLYVIDAYRVAFNRLPQNVEFVRDLGSLTGATAQDTLARRATYVNDFVVRTAFVSAYGAMTNSAYVSALMTGSMGQGYNLTSITTPDPNNPNGTTKVTLTTNDLVNRLNNGTMTRAQVLRAIVQSDQIVSIEAINAFVGSQYYGYLRRVPETGGFNSWVNYLSAHPTDFRTMVHGFLDSNEYRLRFGAP